MIACLAFAGVSLAVWGAEPAPVSMSAKFVGASSSIQNDSNSSQKYCDSEADVLAASTGGFGFTTDDRRGPRKIWVDLKNAVQFNDPPLAATVLPRSEMEFTSSLRALNNPEGTVDDGEGGVLPRVTEVLAMLPGDTLICSTAMSFTDSTSTASNGEYRLRFGQPIYEPNYSWEMSSDCPIKVTAGFDFNHDGLIADDEADLGPGPDGSVDIWTMEPYWPDARAILLKLNKRQQLDIVGFFSVPFKVVFTKQPFGAVLDHIH